MFTISYPHHPLLQLVYTVREKNVKGRHLLWFPAVFISGCLARVMRVAVVVRHANVHEGGVVAQRQQPATTPNLKCC
jgi:hypothetical protein